MVALGNDYLHLYLLENTSETNDFSPLRFRDWYFKKGKITEPGYIQDFFSIKGNHFRFSRHLFGHQGKMPWGKLRKCRRDHIFIWLKKQFSWSRLDMEAAERYRDLCDNCSLIYPTNSWICPFLITCSPIFSKIKKR